MRISLALIVAAWSQSTIAWSREPETPADWQARVDSLVHPALEKKKVVGLVVGISTTDGKRLFFNYGTTKLGGVKPDEHTVFEIGSITKPITALLLAMMVNAEQLQLDDPAQKHLPKELVLPRRGKREITLLELATHTSGLPRLPVNLSGTGKDPNPYGEYDRKKLAVGLLKLQIDDIESPKWAYSNFGYGLLSEVLVNKAGMSYENLLVTRIAKPLGLKNTFLQPTKERERSMAIGHNRKGDETAPWTFQALEGAGAIRSSASDMLTFLEVENGRRKCEFGKALTLSQTPRVKVSAEDDIALGWLVTKQNPRIWHHTGGTGGFRSFAGFCREPAVAVVILSNQSTEGGDRELMEHWGNSLLRELIGKQTATGK
jgi:CubicO group peptidase (beta-lactamase class C family)